MRQYIFRSNSNNFVINSAKFNFAYVTTKHVRDLFSNQESPITVYSTFHEVAGDLELLFKNKLRVHLQRVWRIYPQFRRFLPSNYFQTILRPFETAFFSH